MSHLSTIKSFIQERFLPSIFGKKDISSHIHVDTITSDNLPQNFLYIFVSANLTIIPHNKRVNKSRCIHHCKQSL